MCGLVSVLTLCLSPPCSALSSIQALASTSFLNSLRTDGCMMACPVSLRKKACRPAVNRE